MLDELEVDDPAVVAALYDPLRVCLFRLLEAPRSVAELAEAVDMPANRLYYHVRRLVACGRGQVFHVPQSVIGPWNREGLIPVLRRTIAERCPSLELADEPRRIPAFSDLGLERVDVALG